ncbi:unnamed protein product [Cuscuta epithymum]|uniref:Mitochondrial protein n=1 Tax=Cuscuta epithymum TaxID=186058 RepID=A0AAV0DQY5_9ASTE|nr:unnamed protein product [Cuscuta epithymum]
MAPISMFTPIIEPTSVKQALSHPRWRAVVEEEMAALHRNHTWTLVPRTSQIEELISIQYKFEGIGSNYINSK